MLQHQSHPILVSACLLGIACRYDGKAKTSPEILEKYEQEEIILIPICPEQLGGLPTPRQPSEIVDGDGYDVLQGNARVISQSGIDYTEHFIQGAKQVLHIAKLYRAKEIWLKQSSPSCGCGIIYDGTFTGKRKDGDGVCSALLKQHNLNVIAF